MVKNHFKNFRNHIRQRLKGAFKIKVCSKFPIFFTPLLPCLSIFVLHYSPQRTFALVSYPLPPQKKFHGVYKFSNEKSGSEKKEKK